MMMVDERVYWMMDEWRKRGTSYLNDLSKASFAYAETDPYWHAMRVTLQVMQGLGQVI